MPPQPPPAGGTEAEAGRIHSPSQMFRPASSALVFGVLRKVGSDFFKQTPHKRKEECRASEIVSVCRGLCSNHNAQGCNALVGCLGSFGRKYSDLAIRMNFISIAVAE